MGYNKVETNSRKKILLFTDWYEPGFKAGGPIQSTRHFVHGMRERYDISILTGDTDLGETKTYEGVPANQWITKKDGVKIYYASAKQMDRRGVLKLIREENPDFIYLNSMYSVRYSILPLWLLWRKKISVRIIISPRGMLRESAIGIKTRKKKLFISLLNGLGLPSRMTFHATDEQEVKDIRRYFPTVSRVVMISNFSGDVKESIVPIEKKPGALKCVFISRIMGIKNISFFLRLLTQIPETIDLKFQIFGEVEDKNYWEEAQEIIKTLPAHISVSYGGALQHKDVSRALEANHVFVLPTTGENFGHAIFEALSEGRPVLISDRTPWRALREKQAGWDLSLDDTHGWMQAINEAAQMDQSLYNRWSEKAWQYAKEHADKSDLKTSYTQLFS